MNAPDPQPEPTTTKGRVTRREKAAGPTPKPDPATEFREGLPDRPGRRFLFAFGFSAPVLWIVAVGYGHASAGRAALFAVAVGLGLGVIAALGKRPLAWILNFFSHGGV